jgi:hypothetical protein
MLRQIQERWARRKGAFARGLKARRGSSVRSREMPHPELNLTVGKLPPVFDDTGVSRLRKLIEDFSGFHASRFNR